MAPWRPGQHAAQLALEQPYEDVPTHLEEPLLGWIRRNINTAVFVEAMLIELRLPGHDNFDYLDSTDLAVQRFAGQLKGRSDAILTVVEAILAAARLDSSSLKPLEAVLAQGNSIYRVRKDGRGLELRISAEVGNAVEKTVKAADRVSSSGQHLANAWNGAYGRTPDPVKSYSEAIKAVEAAAATVLSPKNLKATLGTLRGDLRANATLWEFEMAAGGIDTVIAMMSTLWEGQTSRHGGVKPTVPETVEAARAAVHMAATLVQWFISGAVKKK